MSYDYRSASTEGFARFFEHYSEVRKAAVSGDTEQAIAEYGFNVLEQEIFTKGGSDDITISTFYEAAGLMYRYLHDHGADAWQFALETGRYNQLSFIEMFEEHGAQFTESDWQEWMQQQ